MKEYVYIVSLKREADVVDLFQSMPIFRSLSGALEYLEGMAEIPEEVSPYDVDKYDGLVLQDIDIITGKLTGNTWTIWVEELKP